MLTGTKIGKKLALISDEPNPEKGDDDLEILKEIQEVKAYLRKKWGNLYKRFKKQKSMEEVKLKEQPKKQEKFEIPFIPKDLEKKFPGDSARDFCITKFVTKLQTPYAKDSDGNLVNLGREKLIKAVEVAIEVEKSIHEWHHLESSRKEKF